MSTQQHVLLLENIHPIAHTIFKEAGMNVEAISGSPKISDLKNSIKKADFIGIRSKTQLNAEILSYAQNLNAIGCFCIGTNQVDLSAAAHQGIPVFNAPYANTRSVAELVIAEIIMLLRGIPEKNTAAHKGKWLKSAQNSHEARGKTLGIIGYGHIGTQVSVLAENLGMRVLYYDIDNKLSLGNAQSVKTLESLLKQSDVVTLHVPATAKTSLLIGEKELKKMKKGSYLINASRGSVVDIPALTKSLKSQHLLGAAIDVFPKEPAKTSDKFTSSLQNIPNVLLTPHIGGSTEQAQAAIAQDVATKMVHSILGHTSGAVNFPEISPDILPEKIARFIHVHQNRPGMLAAINDSVMKTNANIVSQHLKTKDNIGLAIIDVEKLTPKSFNTLYDAMASLDGTINLSGIEG